MLKIFKMAIPTNAILALTKPYIGAFTSKPGRRRSVAEVGGGQRPVCESN